MNNTNSDNYQNNTKIELTTEKVEKDDDKEKIKIPKVGEFKVIFKKGSKYKYVRCSKLKDGFIWTAAFYFKGKLTNSKIYKTEREAAIAVDLFRISKCMPPINILKPKN